LRSCHFGDKKFKLLHFSHVWPIGTALARQYVTVRFPAHPAIKRMTVNTKNLALFFTVNVA
jgi:hypothetical protein